MTFHRFLNRVISSLSAILLVLFTVVIFIQVILRYLFGITIFWSDELSRFSMVFLVFLGTALATSSKSNIRISALVSMFPHRVQLGFEFFTNLLCILFVTVVSIYSYDFLLSNMDASSQAMKIPMIAIYSIFPIFGALIIYYMAVENIGIIKLLKNKKYSIKSD